MYGKGCYLAENCTKADEYSKDEPGGFYDGIFVMLLCRVCLGKTYYTTHRNENARDHVEDGTHDSTLGDRLKTAGTFREFVVYDANQIYPEYVVVYQRGFKDDDPIEKDAELAIPFHMEVPVYWKNCYIKPREETFLQQYTVRPTTKFHLEELARSCLITGDLKPSSLVVLSARRIEHSLMWTRYVDYKCGLREKALSDGNKFLGAAVLDNTGHVLTDIQLDRFHFDGTISKDFLDEALCEHMLWHGTSRAAAENIVINDFHVPKQSEAIHGTRFGVGAYFAEDLAKSVYYAPDDETNDEICTNDGVFSSQKCILLCRVLCGDMFYTDASSEPAAVTMACALGKNSVLANPNGKGPREFIVPSAEQVYPEYILMVGIRETE
jgi:hypothetical protein